MAKGPQEGETAPDFELEGTDGAFRLSDHRGERVVLLFYPGDNTPRCTAQFCSYAERSDELLDLDATVVGISSQSLGSHTKWRDKHGIPVPLLADADGEVAKVYGCRRPAGLGTARAVVIVDERGRVAHRHDHTLGLDYQSVDDLRKALEGISTRA
jgi:peroxiredoxin Q/BCP